ncbi:hypothetical protein BDN71DRAFT_568122 [Pleurotus eryngii]|uniref:Uncharacterized protein n=1 Tax=Pleurotus eryngii TaxID=5323 RepID=A0A9P5ZLE8_PLEER|nr:hypothetical protein BDN71DRAFT_568122 [Pleurotus eryngii]
MSLQVLQNIHTPPAGLLPHELAAYLFGLAISSPLYAVSICQVIFYFRTYHHDSLYLKGTVYTLIVMGSIRFACLTHTVYTSFETLNDVLHHVDRPIICHENLFRQITLMMVEFLGASLSCIVQSAYVVRLWYLSDRNTLLAGVIVGLQFP